MTLAEDVLKNTKNIIKLNAKIERLMGRLNQQDLNVPETTIYDAVTIHRDDLWWHLSSGGRPKPTLKAAVATIKTEYNLGDKHDAELEAQISDFFSWMYRRNN